MIGPSARFFAWVQAADFYVEMHRDAVALVPRRSGWWLDVGCGPGLVPQLAAAAGFDAVGIDHDRDMVRLARRHTSGPAAPRFEVGDINSLVRGSADVVSATSLLATLPDPERGVRRLWNTLNPGGALLIVETTAQMTPTEARRIADRLPAHGRTALALWSRARSGRALDLETIVKVDAATTITKPLLHGLATATVLTKSLGTTTPQFDAAHRPLALRPAEVTPGQ